MADANRKRRTADGRSDYLRISDALRDRILSADLDVGEYLPSYTEISRAEGVAVSTVQKAVSVLRAEGYVETAPGLGTWVVSTNPEAAEDEQQRFARDIDRRLAALETAVDALTDIISRRLPETSTTARRR